MSCRRGSTCGSRSSSSSSSFGFSGGSSWFRSFHWPSFFRRKPKVGIGNDTLTQEVAASRSAFIDWDALFKGFHNSEEHDSSTVFACKMFELWLKDCGKEFPNDGIVCESVRECLREQCNFGPFRKYLEEPANSEEPGNTEDAK